jgi:hypothetical protein
MRRKKSEMYWKEEMIPIKELLPPRRRTYRMMMFPVRRPKDMALNEVNTL